MALADTALADTANKNEEQNRNAVLSTDERGNGSLLNERLQQP